MSDRTPESFRDFCILMLGSQLRTPLKPEGAEDIINGATISALGEVWKTMTQGAPRDEKPKPVDAQPAVHDPVGILRQ